MLKYLFVCNTTYIHNRTHQKLILKNNFAKISLPPLTTSADHKLFYYYEVYSTMLLAF